MKTKIVKGMFWHVHHNKLCEWCYNEQERIDYIKKEKPKEEVESRLKLLKKLKGKLPEEFIEAWKKSNEAWKKYKEAREKAIEAREKANEAWEKFDEAWEKYKPKIESLHKKECGCKYWNGKKLIFN